MQKVLLIKTIQIHTYERIIKPLDIKLPETVYHAIKINRSINYTLLTTKPKKPKCIKHVSFNISHLFQTNSVRDDWQLWRRNRHSHPWNWTSYPTCNFQLHVGFSVPGTVLRYLPRQDSSHHKGLEIFFFLNIVKLRNLLSYREKKRFIIMSESFLIHNLGRKNKNHQFPSKISKENSSK